jgi:hypothetical protein
MLLFFYPVKSRVNPKVLSHGYRYSYSDDGGTMQMLRKIIGAIVLISGVFFAAMSLIGTANSTTRIISLGVILIGGGIWFLMQIEDAQKQKKEGQKFQKYDPRIPFAKEDELIKYIRANVLVSHTCSNRRYNNKNINIDDLVQDLCDFYEAHFKWPKPTRIRFDNIISIINDESIVVLIKGVNNIVVKVHAPVDTREMETELVGTASSVSGSMARDALNAGRSPGRVNSGVAFMQTLREKNMTVEAPKQQGCSLEESIVKYIDDHIRDNQSSKKNESLDMIDLRNLRNWRT